MASQLKPLVKWPDRELIQSTLPDCFKPIYSRTTCIIDCSEVFIQRPTSLTARAQTYSNYKSHNTVKFLIAISPTGAIILFQNVGEDMPVINTLLHIVDSSIS